LLDTLFNFQGSMPFFVLPLLRRLFYANKFNLLCQQVFKLFFLFAFAAFSFFSMRAAKNILTHINLCVNMLYFGSFWNCNCIFKAAIVSLLLVLPALYIIVYVVYMLSYILLYVVLHLLGALLNAVHIIRHHINSFLLLIHMPLHQLFPSIDGSHLVLDLIFPAPLHG